jgi:hypothetical protein
MRRALPLALALACGGAGSQGAPDGRAPAPPAVVPDHAPDRRAQLLDNLAIIATGGPLVPGAPPPPGPGGVEAYIERLLQAPGTARAAADILVPRATASRPAFSHDDGMVLKLDAGAQVFYLRDPCASTQAERVHPWWALGSTVRVCPDAHRPDRLREPSSGNRCGGNELTPQLSSYCGCGPNLVFCARDADHLSEIKDSLRDEVVSTVEHVVRAGLPVAELFRLNETVRDRNVELRYRRWRIANGEPAEAVLRDLARWPPATAAGPPGRLAPRPELTPGLHAGILTTPQALYLLSGQRERIQVFSELLWCLEPRSQAVTTAGVLGLRTAELRTLDGWRRLAATPGCGDCHARIDYASQFFLGFSWPPRTLDYLREEQPAGHGQLYLRDLDDLRGEAPLTPQGFARLATEQPEFFRCMASRVVEQAFGPVRPPGLLDAVEQALRAQRTYTAMLRVALRAYASRYDHDVPAAAAAAVPAAVPAGGRAARIPLPAGLRSLLETACLSCHDRDGQPPALDGRWLPRPVLEKVVAQVAWEEMPRGRALDADARAALIRSAIQLLWGDDAGALAAASSSFDGGNHALPIQRPEAVMHLIDLRGGRAAAPIRPGPGVTFGGTRRDLELTPGVAVQIARRALDVCKERGGAAAALPACLERAMRLETIVAVPVGVR